jgi:hypothetical protein
MSEWPRDPNPPYCPEWADLADPIVKRGMEQHWWESEFQYLKIIQGRLDEWGVELTPNGGDGPFGLSAWKDGRWIAGDQERDDPDPLVALLKRLVVDVHGRIEPRAA